MNRKFLRSSIFTAALFGLTTTAWGYQQFGTSTIRLLQVNDLDYCLEYGCSSPGCPPATVTLGSFTDPLLPVMKLRSVIVDWRTGNGKQFSFQNVPTVTLGVNGVDIATQTVTNYAACNPSFAQVYSFTSFDYPDGFPGYIRKNGNSTGENTIRLTMQTVDSDIVVGNSAVVTLNWELPPPFEFNVTEQSSNTNDARVILTSSRPEYGYPHFQGLGGEDGKVPMFVRARGNDGQFQANLTVYLRIVDPPDTAQYMNLPTLPPSVRAHAGDNAGPAATLEGNDITPAPNVSGVWQGTSKANGEIDFTIRLPVGAAAGDNYQIEAAFQPTFPTGTTVKSGVLTAWKRIFVEKHKMLRNGIFMTQPASPGDSTIRVASNRYNGNQGRHRISRGDRIVLVHAPAEDGSDLASGWYMEEHDVADVVPGSNEFVVTLGKRNGNSVTPQTLSHPFGPDPSLGADRGLADMIANLTGPTLSTADYFDAPDNLVTGSVFPEAFTEYVILPDGPFGFVPMPDFGTSTQRLLQRFGKKWSTTRAGTAAAPNHQLLIVADSDMDQPTQATGVTVSQVPAETSSWIWRGTIEGQVGTGRRNAPQADLWASKTAVHELAHEFKTNTIFSLNDHCPELTHTYNDPATYCLLANPDIGGLVEAQRTNGIARFHMLEVAPGAFHSEYLEIRRHADPFVP